MKNTPDTRPHIVVAMTAFAPFIGGAEVAVEEIIKRTSDSFRYTVVTARMNPALPARETRGDLDIVRVGWGTPLDKLWLIVVFPWYARSLRPKLVWAVMASYAGAAACFNKILGGSSYVLTLQEGDDLDHIEHRLRYALPLFKQIFARATSIQTIARFLAVWAKKMGATTEPVVVPNGVSCEIFYLEPENRTQCRLKTREKLGIPQNACVALSVSRLVEKNGIGDLIDAAKALPDLHVMLIGDGELRHSLEMQAAPIQERVHFLGTHQQEEIKELASAADIFCRPALSEGQGIAFLEAECMGLPIVSTRVGGIPEIIEDTVHGILVRPHDIMGLAQALERLSRDADLRVKMAIAGSKNVQQFSWNFMAPRIKNWLSSNIK